MSKGTKRDDKFENCLIGILPNMTKKVPHPQITSCMQSSWAISVKVDLNMEGLETRELAKVYSASFLA